MPPTATTMGAFSPLGMCCGRGHGAHRARRTPRHAPRAPLHGPVLLRLPSLNTSDGSRAMRARSARARATSTSKLLRPLLHACDPRHEWRGLGASRARTRAHRSVVAARSRLRIPPRQCDPRPSRARALVSPVQASSSTLSPSAPSRPTLRPMVIPTTAPPTPPSPMPAHQLSRRRRRPLSRRRPSRSARSAKHPSPQPLRRRRRPLSHRRPRRRARPRRACPASDRSPANPK